MTCSLHTVQFALTAQPVMQHHGRLDLMGQRQLTVRYGSRAADRADIVGTTPPAQTGQIEEKSLTFGASISFRTFT